MPVVVEFLTWQPRAGRERDFHFVKNCEGLILVSICFFLGENINMTHLQKIKPEKTVL